MNGASVKFSLVTKTHLCVWWWCWVPPHHLLCYAAHLSHRVSHSSWVTNASSVRSLYSFPVSIVFVISSLLLIPSHGPLLLPVLSLSLSLLTTSCHFFSPPFSVLCSLSLPPSCLAICQPFLVSSLNWPAGNSHSLTNTNTGQHKHYINFFFFYSNLLFWHDHIALQYNFV